jgi:hypothetical protein
VQSAAIVERLAASLAGTDLRQALRRTGGL